MTEKRLEAMRANPRGWSIDDVQAVCDLAGIRCRPPKRGNHYKVSHASQDEILTIPAARPVLPVYIRKLVRFVGRVKEGKQ